MERVTAENPPGSPQASPEGPVFFNGEKEVLAASGLKSALAAEDGAEKQLIQTDDADEKSSRKPPEPQQRFHGSSPTPSRRASFAAALRNERW